MQTVPSATTRTSALAVVSLVFSLLGLTALPVIGSLIAIVTGHLARREIRNTPHVDGDNLAIAGLALGYLGILLAAAAAAIFLLFMGGLAYLSSVF